MLRFFQSWSSKVHNNQIICTRPSHCWLSDYRNCIILYYTDITVWFLNLGIISVQYLLSSPLTKWLLSQQNTPLINQLAIKYWPQCHINKYEYPHKKYSVDKMKKQFPVHPGWRQVDYKKNCVHRNTEQSHIKPIEQRIYYRLCTPL